MGDSAWNAPPLGVDERLAAIRARLDLDGEEGVPDTVRIARRRVLCAHAPMDLAWLLEQLDRREEEATGLRLACTELGREVEKLRASRRRPRG